MNQIFDDGLATETITVTVYGYSHDSGEFIDAYDVRIISGTGIPAFSTLIKPPEKTIGKALVFTGNRWEEVTDYRGNTVYSVSTGDPVTVTDLGDIKSGFTLVKPTTQYDKWDGEKWVTDTTAQYISYVADANAKKERLLDIAAKAIAPLQDAIDIGEATPDEYVKLNAWKKFRVEVNRIDTSAAQNISWPVQPE